MPCSSTNVCPLVPLKTTDGVNWKQIFAFPTNASASSIAISETNDTSTGAKVYYVGVVGTTPPSIYSSRDAGNTWNTTPSGRRGWLWGPTPVHDDDEPAELRGDDYSMDDLLAFGGAPAPVADHVR